MNIPEKYSDSKVLRPMYPNRVDRLRLVQLLFRHLRTSDQAFKQDDLAENAGVSQGTISRVQHLVRDDEIQATVGRDTLLKLFCLGLKLPRDHVDALMWLVDGSPVSPGEARLFMPSSVAHEQNEVTEETLRQTVLSLLQGLLLKQNSPHNATVAIRFDADEKARLAEAKELLDHERRAGQRMLVTRIPSSLTNPRESFATGQLTPPSVQTAELKQTFQSIHLQRHETFLRAIQEYGERSIHSKRDLEAYVNDVSVHFTTIEQRRRQIANFIDLLEKYESYEVGLVDGTPELELGIKSTVVAVVRGATRYDHTRSTIWGLHHIFWHDEFTVLFFLLNFEHRWMSIPSVDRTRANVIAWLKELISSSTAIG